MDYYFAGVKIDPRHYGCVYNIACTYFGEKKYANANMWFSRALKIDTTADALFGKSITALKLGLQEEAL